MFNAPPVPVMQEPAESGLILDTYSPTAAYGFVPMKTGQGAVCRLLRTSDNAESDFTVTELTDGTATTWTGANDGNLIELYDLTGNGFHLDYSASTIKVIKAGVLVTKDGLTAAEPAALSTARLRAVNLNAGADVSTFSIFSLVAYAGTGAGSRSHGFGSEAYGDALPVFNLQGDGSIRFGASNLSGSAPTANALISRTTIANGTTVSDWIDGSLNINAGSLSSQTFDDEFGIGAMKQASDANKLLSFLVFLTEETTNRLAIEAAHKAAHGL